MRIQYRPRRLVAKSLVLLPFLLLACQAVQVLVSTSPAATQWTCFATEDLAACCDAIYTVNEWLGRIDFADVHFCRDQIATIPAIPRLPSLARFSLTLPNNEALFDNQENAVTQILFDDIDDPKSFQELDIPTSPFTLQPLFEIQDVSVDSSVSTSGGHHRVLNTKIRLPSSAEQSYLILTIPKAMFLDLDDFIEESEEVVLHATGIIDIEQPAFVSGQHVVIIELNKNAEFQLEGKVHLRYPAPSADRESRISLPAPRLVVLQAGQEGPIEHISSLEASPLQIWVAAGNDEDFDSVMWMTIAACCFGIMSMMLDISGVSEWDKTN